MHLLAESNTFQSRVLLQACKSAAYSHSAHYEKHKQRASYILWLCVQTKASKENVIPPNPPVVHIGYRDAKQILFCVSSSPESSAIPVCMLLNQAVSDQGPAVVWSLSTGCNWFLAMLTISLKDNTQMQFRNQCELWIMPNRHFMGCSSFGDEIFAVCDASHVMSPMGLLSEPSSSLSFYPCCLFSKRKCQAPDGARNSCLEETKC